MAPEVRGWLLRCGSGFGRRYWAVLGEFTKSDRVRVASRILQLARDLVGF